MSGGYKVTKPWLSLALAGDSSKINTTKPAGPVLGAVATIRNADYMTQLPHEEFSVHPVQYTLIIFNVSYYTFNYDVLFIHP